MRLRPVAAALLLASFALTFLLDPWQHELVSDLPLYRGYADLFLDGSLPYRDVGFEYPPLAAPLIALPGLASLELDGYRLAFTLAMLAAAGALALSGERLAALTGGYRGRALLGIAVAPVLTGALIRTHFDLVPVLCLAAGLAGIAGTRPRLGFALLGVGGALKFFPLVAVPVAVAWLAGRGRLREGMLGTAVAAGALGAAVACAVALSSSGAWDAVDYHLERPVQVESLPATVLNGIEAVGGRAPERIHSHQSDGLEHPASGAIEGILLALLALTFAALVAAAHRVPDARGMVLSALTAVTALAAFGKVLSPQFMVWLVPLAALAFAWRMHALAVCVAAAIAATQLWFPERYFDLVARQDGPAAAVALRNLLLLAALGLAARELLRLARASRAAAGSTPPAHPGRPRSALR